MQPNLALAIEDFLPVLLTFLALLWLGQMILSMHRSSGAVAAFGMVLIVAGRALKAVSKLIWALFGNPVAWMDDSLFVLMAPGFACFTWALWSAQRSWFQKVSARCVWQVPVVVLLISGLGVTYATVSEGSRIWFFVTLTTVVIMSTLMSGLLVRQAWWMGRRGISLIFAVYLVSTLVLNGMARTTSETISYEWLKQLVNTFAAGIFAFAAWQLMAETA